MNGSEAAVAVLLDPLEIWISTLVLEFLNRAHKGLMFQGIRTSTLVLEPPNSAHKRMLRRVQLNLSWWLSQAPCVCTFRCPFLRHNWSLGLITMVSQPVNPKFESTHAEMDPGAPLTQVSLWPVLCCIDVVHLDLPLLASVITLVCRDRVASCLKNKRTLAESDLDSVFTGTCCTL